MIIIWKKQKVEVCKLMLKVYLLYKAHWSYSNINRLWPSINSFQLRINFVIAILKKSYWSNRMWYFCHWSTLKYKTKQVFGTSVNALNISFLFAGASSEKDEISSIGWRNKYKDASSSCSHRTRGDTYLESPNFPLS